MKPTLKEIIWEAHPYKTRLEKLRLLKYLPEIHQKITNAASLLGLQPPPPFDATLCEIDEDYLIIRSPQELIGKAYIGTDCKLTGHIILASGEEFSEHSYHQLTGKGTNEYGYIEGCGCLDCQSSVLQNQSRVNEERLKRYEERAIIVGLNPEDKIRTVSERLQGLVDAPTNIPRTPMTKIKSPTNNDKRLFGTGST
jgi:hypothetical protein